MTHGRIGNDASPDDQKEIAAFEKRIATALGHPNAHIGWKTTAALFNIMCDMLDCAPDEVRKNALGVILLTLASNYSETVNVNVTTTPEPGGSVN